MELYQSKILRRLFLPLFSKINLGNITINHHFTGEKVLLHSFKHKGYWFHGKNREKDTMRLFKTMIKEKDVVIEVGGHIGYISLYFSSLVKGGLVYVFEPGPNNLPYIRGNLKSKTNIVIVEKGVGSCNVDLTFYTENLTGQNNSFVKNFSGFEENKKNAFNPSYSISETMVQVVKLDDFILKEGLEPNFIKVDVEGFEFEVIKGMLNTLKNVRPKLMIEIQDNYKQIYDIMNDFGYVMFNDELRIINHPNQISMNTFLLHRQEHLNTLAKLGISV